FTSLSPHYYLHHRYLHSFPTRRSSDLMPEIITGITQLLLFVSMLQMFAWPHRGFTTIVIAHIAFCTAYVTVTVQSRLQSADRSRSEEHTSELQSLRHLVCRLLLEKKKI